MKYLSLFSGIGGFELGIQQAYDNRELLQGKTTEDLSANSTNTKERQTRATCIGYSEVDKYAIQIYEKHFNHKNYGDITTIIPSTLPSFDLLVGGFPCQSFSIAGKRKGFTDTRGTLFFEIARIVREKQPRLLLLENVKGLLSHDKGRTFYTIISTLDELGYDCQWQVLNSKNFGVPQNRERVFIVGHLRGTSRPKVFPITETGKKVKKVNQARLRCLYDGNFQSKRVYGKDGLSPTIPTACGGQHIPFLLDEVEIRRLTPTECERLQGFPDGWTEGVSDTQRYKCLGNAVTVNVITAIMEKIFDTDNPSN